MNNVNTRWVLYRGTLWDTKYIVGIFKSKESAMQTLNKFATPENYYIGVIDWEE